MKPFLSVILAVVLVVAVAGSMVNGTMAGFFDTEVSTENHMQSGVRMIELSGGPIQVDAASPCTWYEHEMAVVNVGNLDGNVWLHLMNLESIEDEPGSGEATAEPEFVAEEGGYIGENAGGDPVYIGGLGTDCGDDTLGPPGLAMAEFVNCEIWYDDDNDGLFEELIVSDKLADIACQWYELGPLPASTQINKNNKGGGWSTYFPYTIGESMESVLIAGQNFVVGRVTIETVDTNLVVTYDTTAYQWPMKESHLYVGIDPPPKMAPGKFPYTSNTDNKAPGDTQYNKTINGYLHEYTIPLSTISVDPNEQVFIAAHAAELGGRGDTSWAMGEYRKLQIRLHFPDIDEDDLIAAGILMEPKDPPIGDGGWFNGDDPDIAKMCWDKWPTNAYMGDKCTFDIECLLKKDSSTNGCSECNGKVTQLTLQYNGSEDATITVKQKGKNGETVFDGFVEAGAQFTFTGMDKNGTLGKEISIYVNGELNTKIHTSCSKPIGPGLVSGAFEVIEGYSKDGGLLCR